MPPSSACYRAPAVIVLHPDGTFHATQGSLTTGDAGRISVAVFAARFRADVQSARDATPGVRLDRDWESARRGVQASGKPIFVVLERWMSRDWDSLATDARAPRGVSRTGEHDSLPTVDRVEFGRARRGIAIGNRKSPCRRHRVPRRPRAGCARTTHLV